MLRLETGFSLYFGSEIQGLSSTLKLHFQGPIVDGSLQHGQLQQHLIFISVITVQFFLFPFMVY